MTGPQLPLGLSYGENQFYSSGYPLYGTPSQGGNIYPHMSNPCHVTFPSQENSSVSFPLQPFMNQYGGGYYPAGQGQGVNQDPSWPAISQNQYFLGPWSQIPQFTTATSPVTACHTGIISTIDASHVGDWSTTSTSHVEDLQPAATSHARGTSLVIVCHTGVISPTSASHVGDWSKTSASHVEDLQPATASHAGGTCLVTTNHTAHPSPNCVSHVGDSPPTSASHVGDFLLASASHDGSMSPATASHVGGIHMIENPRRLRRKPRFLCRTCEGSHLTRLCHVNARIQEAWGSPKGPSGSEASMVSQHSVPSLVDTTIMPMQSSAHTSFPLGVDASFDLVVSHLVQPMVMSMQSSTDTSPMFGGDASLELVVSHLVQPTVVSMQSSTDNTPVFWGDAPLDLIVSHPIHAMVEEVAISMQYSIDPTLLLESDKSKETIVPMQFLVDSALLVLVLYLLCHVLRISSTTPSELERVLLFLSSLPPSLKEIPFDWGGLVGYPMPPPMSFPGRDII
jgi:hypothetical protein